MLIEYKNVNVYQDDREVLRGVDFHVDEGEFIYIIGKVGTGKSSFLKTIYCELDIDEEDADTAEVLGRNLKTLRRREVPALRKELGVIFQDFQLLHDRSVWENLQFVLKSTGWKDKAERTERIEKVLADVGLLGMPNAGKSTFIAAVSNARPKIADYPFTTLYPNLGVVRVGPQQSFVVADIPGLIEGASEGAGLGHQFLRHLQRTRLLLHIVDLAPFDEESDPVEQARAIVQELKKYDQALYEKPRWLVLNKLDMVPPQERAARVQDFVHRLRWKGPVYEISALTREGCQPLIHAIYEHIRGAQQAECGGAPADPRFAPEAQE